MSNTTIRFYIITDTKIIRVGADSDNKRKFPDYSGKTAVLLELFYSKTEPLSFLRSNLALIKFDPDGRWSISQVEEQRAVHKMSRIMNGSTENVSFIPGPKINRHQKALLQERIVKDLGIHFWNSLKNNIPVYQR